MKVGDGNNAPVGGELLERMREAHRQEAAGAVDEAGESSGASGAADIRSATGAEAPAATNALQERLLDTAERALDGAFGSADALREAVVESIIEERYADGLPPAQAEQITRTLKASLSSDPVFRSEVDNMLLHAARELARRGD